MRTILKIVALASVVFVGAAGVASAQKAPGAGAQCIEGCTNYCNQQPDRPGTAGYQSCIAQCNAYVAEYCDQAGSHVEKSPASMTVYERAQMLVRKAEPVRQSFIPATADK